MTLHDFQIRPGVGSLRLQVSPKRQNFRLFLVRDNEYATRISAPAPSVDGWTQDIEALLDAARQCVGHALGIMGSSTSYAIAEVRVRNVAKAQQEAAQ